ncbi:MAG: hypothetical protein WC239_02480 [Sphaerochaetaceae bacterium]
MSKLRLGQEKVTCCPGVLVPITRADVGRDAWGRGGLLGGSAVDGRNKGRPWM